MNFKVIAAVLSVSLLTSCVFPVGEEAPAPKPFKVAGELEGCLTNYDEVIVNYFDGTAKEKEVNDIFSCIVSAVDIFTYHTRGRIIGIYQQEELRSFLNKYFLKDKSVSSQFMREAMVLKRALFGGSPENMTFAEITRIKELFVMLKGEALRMRTQMPITPESLLKRRSSKMNEAAESIELLGQRVGAFLQVSAKSYSFESLASLLDEVVKVIEKETGTRSSLREIRQNIELIKSLKAIAIGDPADQFLSA